MKHWQLLCVILALMYFFWVFFRQYRVRRTMEEEERRERLRQKLELRESMRGKPADILDRRLERDEKSRRKS